MIKTLSGFDPSVAEERMVQFGSEREALKKANYALMELRGETPMEQTQGGGFKGVKSGLSIKPAADIYAVPIINRRSGEVRHLDMSEKAHAARTQMRMMFEGVWRFATPEEQKAGLAKDESERQAIKREQQKALTQPAELIGQEIGKQLGQFAEAIKTKKA